MDPQSLIQKRGRVKGILTRLKGFSENIAGNVPTEDIYVRLKSLDDAWNEFQSIEDNLLLFENQGSNMEEYERTYYETKSALTRALNTRIPIPRDNNDTSFAEQFNSTMSQFMTQQQGFFQTLNQRNVTNTSAPFNSSQAAPTARLPKLNVPSFTGEYSEWPSFKDLFEASVHNNPSLTASQKLQYLKGYLVGNASAVIKHLTISDANYDEAWAKLNKRFDKRNQIINSFIRTFTNHPSIMHPGIKSLRSLYDTFDEVIRGLKALGNQAESRDPWLIYLALSKVDNETKELWATKVIEIDSPTFQDFLNFLSNRCDALETCTALGKRVTVPVKTFFAASLSEQASSTTLSCPKCSKDHRLYECDTFKAESVENRKAFVFSKSLCFKCLGTNHTVRSCRSKVHCKLCNGQHHPLLHISTGAQTVSSHVSQAYEPTHNCSMSIDFNKAQPSICCPTPPINSSSINTIPSINTSSINQMPTLNKAINSTINTECQENPGTSFSSLNACIKGKLLHVDINPEVKSSANMIGALLPTAMANVCDNQGRLISCRILLDSGSQISLISESCAQLLGLKRENARLSVTGLQSSGAGITRGKLSINIHSRWSHTASIKATVFILNKLTCHVPTVTQVIPKWLNVDGLQLADPRFNQSSHIDIILGADYFFETLYEERLHNDVGQLYAQNSMFGWVLFGNLQVASSSALSLTTTIEHIDQTLQRFWQTEEVSQRASPLTSEEIECEQHFVQNVTRNQEGRYIVSLPFKNSTLELGESTASAVKRLFAMERRFLKDHVFKEQYVSFMREYIELGHMEIIPKADKNKTLQDCYYLPHHAVFKSSPEPKIRVVFDGSCKTSSGLSLNEKLMVGPTIQRDLLALLLSFRKSKIAFSADVEKMYRQVLVNPVDRDHQRIVWRESPSSSIDHYRLKTVTYGTASAPFLATRVLHKIGEHSREKFPKACSIIQSDFYVDDLLSGCESLSEALSLKAEITDILESGGFHLTKWKSNSPDLVKEDSTAEINSSMKIDSNPEVTKVLGVLWNHKEDIFSFTVSLIVSERVSKRTILSESSRIFDPLGWLAPTVVVVKILFQELWTSKYDWDDKLCSEILQRWVCWKSQLPELMRIKVPRQIWSTPTNIQLHGFSDASESAYGAVVYCRSINTQGKAEVRIVAAKTKVAPLKQISLPRLELCAALLLVRLIEKIKDSLDLKDVTLYTWTDSQIVLAWLSDVPRRWKTYVANRTAEILEAVPRFHWRHVPSKQNPADLASRGVAPRDLPSLQLWWMGPTWLSQEPSNWPNIQSCSENNITQEERTKIISSNFQGLSEDAFSKVISRVSSYSKLIRIVAYCLRFAVNSKVERDKRKSGYLGAREIVQATVVCIRCTQEQHFSSEIRQLTTGQNISKKSSLKSLSPFLDQDGVLRVGGRLQKSQASFNAKHPMILPKNCALSELLANEMHRTYQHPGTTLLIAILRQRYWLIGVRDLIRRVSKNCVTCFRQRTVRSTQLMGNLPEQRVTANRAFLKVGVDYAGPLSLKTKTGRGAKTYKAYIALFICLASKALHLELVTSLSTEAFIAALRRFIARRGIPSNMYSDNGTNFVGAKRYLNELHKFVLSSNTNETFCYFLSQSRITWSFIPPNAPHFGGLWEVNVKAVKWHMRRVLGDNTLTFEEMTTFLYQIEAILNSRPYCALTLDPDDYDALTPSHFLIGEPLTTLPEPNLTETSTSRLGRWQQLQAMVQGFWKRWRLEYLSSLQERPKWRKNVDSLKRDELVLISDDNLPPSRWLLGRVEATHPGEDGLVRVVTLRTKKGMLKRAVNKLFKLPTS